MQDLIFDLRFNLERFEIWRKWRLGIWDLAKWYKSISWKIPDRTRKSQDVSVNRGAWWFTDRERGAVFSAGKLQFEQSSNRCRLILQSPRHQRTTTSTSSSSRIILVSHGYRPRHQTQHHVHRCRRSDPTHSSHRFQQRETDRGGLSRTISRGWRTDGSANRWPPDYLCNVTSIHNCSVIIVAILIIPDSSAFYSILQDAAKSTYPPKVFWQYSTTTIF